MFERHFVPCFCFFLSILHILYCRFVGSFPSDFGLDTIFSVFYLSGNTSQRLHEDFGVSLVPSRPLNLASTPLLTYNVGHEIYIYKYYILYILLLHLSLSH